MDEKHHGNERRGSNTIADHEILGSNKVEHDEALHLSQLTPDELVLQKKLRKKIDMLIMPMVVLVSLNLNTT